MYYDTTYPILNLVAATLKGVQPELIYDAIDYGIRQFLIIPPLHS